MSAALPGTSMRFKPRFSIRFYNHHLDHIRLMMMMMMMMMMIVMPEVFYRKKPGFSPVKNASYFTGF